MKIEILVSSALVDEKTGQRAGLHETLDVAEGRAKYLIGLKAARPAAEDEAPKRRKAAEKADDGDEGTEAPEKAAEPAAPARKPASPTRKPAAK